jgi:hypothetical protein
MAEALLAGKRHGPVMSVRGTGGNRIALWCRCQRWDNLRAPWLALPVEIRSRWTVPEALAALAAAGHGGPEPPA